MALKSSRIVDFGDKSRRFADLKNTVDRGSAEPFGPVSGFCQSRSLDCGSDHQFSVGLGQCAGVLSANVPLPRFPEETFSSRDSYGIQCILVQTASGNLMHGSFMVTHGSGNGGTYKVT